MARREAPPDDANRRHLQVGDVGLERLEKIDIQRVGLIRPVQRQLADAVPVSAKHEIIQWILSDVVFQGCRLLPTSGSGGVHRLGVEAEPGTLPHYVSRRRCRVVSADD